MKGFVTVAAAGLLLSLSACGGSNGSPGTATVSIGITDNATGFDSVVLTITSIGIVASDTPTTYFDDAAVSALPLTLDVLDYPSGHAFHLADVEVPLPGGGGPLCFNQIRLVLASEGDPDCDGPFCNYVIETGGIVPLPLKTPSGQQSGIKLLTPNHFCAENGETAVQVAIDFDPATAIVHDDKKGEYLLKPTGIRIIEGEWSVPQPDYVEGVVRIPAESGAAGCVPFATTPLVIVNGWPADVTGDPVATTASLADEMTADCFYVGRYKLLLPEPGLYDISAGWLDYSAALDNAASGGSGVDLQLSR